MVAQDKVLTAYCGLYCGDCIRYNSKAADIARELLNELSRTNFEHYAKVKRINAKEFERYGAMIQVAQAINKLKCDTPCRLGGDGCDTPCEIVHCVSSKNIEGCWECSECEGCANFGFLKPIHGDGPQKNLKKIKKYGLDKWAVHREKCYPWL